MHIGVPLMLFYYTILSSKYCTAANGHRRLVKKLFDDYDIGLRPVLNNNNTVNVTVGFGIIQLLNVADKSKTFQAVCYMGMEWKDDYLSWNPAEYDYITEFHYPHTSIWKPDIILANTDDLNDGSVISRASTNILIDNWGTVTNEFTAVFTPTCATMDITNFPFDEHTCFLDFTSWTYNMNYVNVFDDNANYVVGPAMKYIPNSEWDVNITGSVKINEWQCCPNETYPILRYIVHLKRKPLYYLINIVIPTSITCYIAFLGMFSPSTSTGERNEKAFLGITTLLAVSMLMLAVSAQMPVTSTSIPLIGYFLGVYILTIAIGIICTTIIMQIDVHGWKGNPVPQWADKWFLQRLGVWLYVCQPSEDENFRKKNLVEQLTPKSNMAESKITELYPMANKENDLIVMVEKTVNRHFDQLYTAVLNNKAKKEQLRKNREAWTILCQVLDRICLIVFIAWSTIFTIVILK